MTGGEPFRRLGTPTRSMATVVPGEVVCVETILIDTLRRLCHDIGVHEGERLHCRTATAELLLLETMSGHVVALRRESARFIRVSDLPVERIA